MFLFVNAVFKWKPVRSVSRATTINHNYPLKNKTKISLQWETDLSQAFLPGNYIFSMLLYTSVKAFTVGNGGHVMRLIEAIGIRLDKLIKARDNLTEYELAKQAGMPRSTIWKIINPDLTRVKTVKIDTLYQIVDTLGISLKEFFDDPLFDDISD